MNHHFRNLVRVVIKVVIISQGAPCEQGEVHIWSFPFWSLECKKKRVVYKNKSVYSLFFQSMVGKQI